MSKRNVTRPALNKPNVNARVSRRWSARAGKPSTVTTAGPLAPTAAKFWSGLLPAKTVPISGRKWGLFYGMGIDSKSGTATSDQDITCVAIDERAIHPDCCAGQRQSRPASLLG